MVIDAFAVAPLVKNPDHKIGVRLHIDLGPDSVMNPLTGVNGAPPHRGRLTCRFKNT